MMGIFPPFYKRITVLMMLKTANALGLAVSKSLLNTADEVIE